MRTENQNSIEVSKPMKMAKMYQKMPFLRILLFLWHFCRFLLLGHLNWILVFSSHLVRPRHNFWYPYCLYLWEKNIWWTKGGPFDFNGHPNASATLQTLPIWLKIFFVRHMDPYNGKMWLANWILSFVAYCSPPPYPPVLMRLKNLKKLAFFC